MAADPLVIQLVDVVVHRGAGSQRFTLEVPTLTLALGQCFAITGPSGCGKSTVLDLLGLVLRPDRAQRFELTDRLGRSQSAAALWEGGRGDQLARLRARNIGYVLQTGGLLPFLSARGNVELSLRLLGERDDALVEHIVDKLGIRSLLDKPPRALSIGERQRVAIARALAHRPTLLLADEPTAALDPPQAIAVTELVLQLVGELDMTAVIVTHDWELVSSMGLTEIRADVLRLGTGSGTRFLH